MRRLWTIAALLVAAAAAVALWPTARRAGPVDPVIPADASPPVPPAGTPPTAAPTVHPASADTTPDPADPLGSLVGGSLFAPAGTDARAPEVTVGAPAAIERVDDRTIRIDGKYTVRGSGTESDPYQISWEMLGSAALTVDPAARRFEIPGRIADLRGAWVRISGYWAPPLQVFEAREAMLMLNKWDGCCVGLPPTPFDSIEATFVHPIAVRGAHVYRYGTFRGRLSVEPFVAGTFLLGLYRLQDAVMESSS